MDVWVCWWDLSNNQWNSFVFSFVELFSFFSTFSYRFDFFFFISHFRYIVIYQQILTLELVPDLQALECVCRSLENWQSFPIRYSEDDFWYRCKLVTRIRKHLSFIVIKTMIRKSSLMIFWFHFNDIVLQKSTCKYEFITDCSILEILFLIELILKCHVCGMSVKNW